MATIAFIGLGNMGGPMARNLVKAGHSLRGFDMVSKNVEAAGATVCKSAADAVKGAEIVVTMLPAGPHVRGVYDEILPVAAKGTLLADCSTIDVDTARAVAKKAEGYGLDMVDAPVSGGTGGAEAATLTFMVGGSARAFERAQPLLAQMGKTIVHAGGPGNGQFEIVGPVLVDDDLLPGAGTGADVSGQPRLQAGLHRRHDAEGPETRPGGRPECRAVDAAGRRGAGAVRSDGIRRPGCAGFFRHYQNVTR